MLSFEKGENIKIKNPRGRLTKDKGAFPFFFFFTETSSNGFQSSEKQQPQKRGTSMNGLSG
jgi:hypothetical protein